MLSSQKNSPKRILNGLQFKMANLFWSLTKNKLLKEKGFLKLIDSNTYLHLLFIVIYFEPWDENNEKKRWEFCWKLREHKRFYFTKWLWNIWDKSFVRLICKPTPMDGAVNKKYSTDKRLPRDTEIPLNWLVNTHKI